MLKITSSVVKSGNWMQAAEEETKKNSRMEEMCDTLKKDRKFFKWWKTFLTSLHTCILQ